MVVRLNKFLSQAGVASRREADALISAGRIKVNSKVIRELGYKVDEREDKVEFDGKRVARHERSVYIMLNKPAGYIVTLKDPLRRPTIKELLPSLNQRIFPVGRLDSDSQGLLLLTNDGELAYRLTHPRFKVKKTYLVKVKGQPDYSKVTKLERGIFLEGKKTAPARASLLKGSPRKSSLKIEIYEGRKREVRRMFEAIGHRVVKLERVKFGGLTLGKLKMGHWRFLRQKEIEVLKNKVVLKD